MGFALNKSLNYTFTVVTVTVLLSDEDFKATVWKTRSCGWETERPGVSQSQG